MVLFSTSSHARQTGLFFSKIFDPPLCLSPSLRSLIKQIKAEPFRQRKKWAFLLLFFFFVSCKQILPLLRVRGGGVGGRYERKKGRNQNLDSAELKMRRRPDFWFGVKGWPWTGSKGLNSRVFIIFSVINFCFCFVFCIFFVPRIESRTVVKINAQKKDENCNKFFFFALLTLSDFGE